MTYTVDGFWRRRWMPTWLLALFSLLSIIVLTLGSAAFYTRTAFEGIPTFQTGTSGNGSQSPLRLSPPVSTEPRNFLIFSLGSDGISVEDAAALGIPKERAKMGDGLTDSLMLAMINPATGQAGVFSIPRDTWIPAHKRRINAIYSSKGPQEFAQTVADLTGQPIHHLVAVNFKAFADLTDAVGGVEMAVQKPIRDRYTGLQITEPGCYVFDGKQALAWVRSRHAQTLRKGRWVADASASDFGRIERQQVFIRAAASQVLQASSVLRSPQLVGVAQDNLVIDAGLTPSSLIDLARSMSGRGTLDLHMASADGQYAKVGEASVIKVDVENVHREAAVLAAKVAGTYVAPPPASVPATSATPPASSPAGASPRPKISCGR